MRHRYVVALIAGICAMGTSALADTPLAELPIREVVAFKDGSAYVHHVGTVDVDDAGTATLTGIPRPYLGTFWARSVTGPTILSVRAHEVDTRQEISALNLADLLRANPGATIAFVENEKEYRGRLLPSDKSAQYFFVEIAEEGSEKPGIYVLHPSPDQQIRLFNATQPKLTVSGWNTDRCLELKFDKPGRADVDVTYVQNGLRWYPSYRVALVGDDKADLELQATVENELTDLEDVLAHFVVGVPTFQFADRIDPISMIRQPPDADGAGGAYNGSRRSRGDMAMSNALMSQSSSYFSNADESGGGAAAPPPDAAGTKAEDLYYYTIEDITVAKGERLALPLRRATICAEQIFTLTIPFGVPAPLLQSMGYREQPGEMEREMARPKVKTVARLTNDADFPLTTAPALIFKDGKPLAQSLLRYAPVGGSVDVEIGTAVDIAVRREDRETGREEGVVINGSKYYKSTNAGEIHLSNRRGTPVKIEVRREIAGTATAAEGGDIRHSTGEWDDANVSTAPGLGYIYWPWYWWRLNGFSIVTWNVELEPGEQKSLTCEWFYYWS